MRCYEVKKHETFVFMGAFIFGYTYEKGCRNDMRWAASGEDLKLGCALSWEVRNSDDGVSGCRECCRANQRSKQQRHGHLNKRQRFPHRKQLTDTVLGF
jgi:hypothetical protein